MGQKMWGYCYALAVLTSIALAAPLTAADDAAGESSSSGQTRASIQAAAERRIEAALDSPLKAPLEFIATPLNQVTQVLSEDYDLPIVIDVAALDAVASSPEVEVNSSIGNVTLRSALELILQNLGEGDLTYIIDNEVLLITSQEEAEKRLQTLVYRIDDLIDSERLVTVAERDAAISQLNDVIVSAIEHESWMENGTGEGDIEFFGPGVMVISQTSRVHDQVELLLQRLRAAKSAIDADAAQDRAEAAGQPITRSIALSDPAIAENQQARDAIRDAIRQSVDWQRQVEGLEESERFLYVLPNRILVRHVPEVVRQVSIAAEEVCASGARGPAGIGCTLGRPGGSGANGAEPSGGTGIAPAN